MIRAYAVLRGIAVSILMGALASGAFAFSYRGLSLSEMNVGASVIAIGILTQENRQRGLFGTLKVEQVIGGEGVRPGETLAFEIQPMMSVPDSERTIRAIVWLARGPDGFVLINHSNSVRPVEEKTLARIRADLAVVRDPLASMAVMNVSSAPALNAWIEQRWVNRDAKPTAEERRTAIAYLLLVAKKGPEGDRAKAMEILAAFAAPEAYDVFVAALVSCGTCDRAALKGLERLRDPRAVPALRKFLAANPHLREEVMHVLGSLSDAKSVPWLIAQLKAKPSLEAAEALAKLGDERALPALLDFVWQSPYSDVAVVRGFDKSVVLREARLRLEDLYAAAILVAALGDQSDAAFMHRFILQGNTAGLAWAKNNPTKENLDIVAHAARTTHDRQFLIEALALLREMPGPRPDEFAAALRFFRERGYEYLGINFIEVRLGKPPTGPGDPDRRGHAFQALRADPARFGLVASDLIPLAAWETIPRMPVPSDQKLAGLTEDQVRALLFVPFDDVRFAALDYCISHGFLLRSFEVDSLRYSSLMDYYLKQMADDRIDGDEDLLASLVAEPWAQSIGALYESIRKTKAMKAKAPLKDLLQGNSSGVRMSAAMTLAHLGDRSGLDIMKQALQRAERAENTHHQWMDEVSRAIAQLEK